MGQQSGGVNPGSYPNTPGCQVPPQPPQQDVNQVYDQYGMHHYGTAQTLDQLQAKVQIQAQAEHGPFGVLLALAQMLTKPQSMLDAQAERLAKAQGLKRSAPEAPAVNYLGLSHQELYDAVQQAQPGQVHAVADTWTQIGNSLTKVQGRLAGGIAGSQSGWTGASAEKAREAVAKIGDQAGGAGQGAQLAGTMIERQATSLSTAKANVPKPPAKPFDPQAAAAHLQTITDPVARTKQAHADARQQAQEKAAHQQAAQAVQTYDQTSAQIASSQPAFAPAPPSAKPGGGGDVTGGGAGPGPGGESGGISPGPIIPAGGGGGGPSYSGGGHGGPAHSVGPTVPGGGSGSGSHHAGGSGAGGGQAGGPNIPGGGDGQTTTSSAAGYGPGGAGGLGGPGGAGGGYGESAYGGSRYGAGPGASAGGFGGAGGATLGGVGGEFGGSSGAGRSGGFGGSGARGGAIGAGAESGARSGAAASTAEGSALSRGAGGARGGAGMGMAPHGGRGGRGGEDNEHQTASYLQEPDPDEIFGSDERTAPPVIGDWFADD